MRSLIARSIAIAFVLAMSAALMHRDSRAGTAGETRTQWATLRLQGIVTIPLAENHVEGWNDCSSEGFDFLNFTSSIDVNTAWGILGSFEYVLKGRYGLEVNLIYWHEIVGLHFETEDLEIDGSPNFIFPTLGLNYHFLTDEKKDLYAGGLCGLGVVATGVLSDIEISKDVSLGLNFGMDYFIKDSWSLGGSLKYVDFGEVDFSILPPGVEGFICDNGLFGIGHLNFVSLTFGIGYRF